MGMFSLGDFAAVGYRCGEFFQLGLCGSLFCHKRFYPNTVLCYPIDFGCPDQWTQWEVNSQCYKLFNEKISWEEAEEKCREEKGDLASISSAAESEFSHNFAAKQTVWIGASDKVKEGV